MILNIKYYGLITEITSCSEEQLDFNESTFIELKALLLAKYPALETTSFQIAADNTMVNDNDKITNSNLAIMPPFAGG